MEKINKQLATSNQLSPTSVACEVDIESSRFSKDSTSFEVSDEFEVVNYISTVVVKPFLDVCIHRGHCGTIVVESSRKERMAMGSDEDDFLLVCNNRGIKELLEKPLDKLDEWSYAVDGKTVDSIDEINGVISDTIYVNVLSILVDYNYEKTLVVRSYVEDAYKEVINEMTKEYSIVSVVPPVEETNIPKVDIPEKSSVFDTICKVFRKIIKSMNCLSKSSVDTK